MADPLAAAVLPAAGVRLAVVAVRREEAGPVAVAQVGAAVAEGHLVEVEVAAAGVEVVAEEAGAVVAEEEAGVAVAPTACSSARSSALAMAVSRPLRTSNPATRLLRSRSPASKRMCPTRRNTGGSRIGACEARRRRWPACGA